MCVFTFRDRLKKKKKYVDIYFMRKKLQEQHSHGQHMYHI